MILIGYHDGAGALVVLGRGVYPPGTLRASAKPAGVVSVKLLSGSTEFEGHYSWVGRINGSSFTSQQDAISYLTAQFSRGVSVALVDGGIV